MHDQNGGLYVHDIVFLWLKEKPVVEKGQFGIAGCHLTGTSGEEPTDHSPSGDYIRAKQLIGRVDDSDNEANKITTKRLGFRR